MKLVEGNTEKLDNMCKNITMLRRRRNLTVTEVAIKTGVPQHLLLRVENGIVSPEFGLDYLFRICRFYEVSPCQLFHP